MISGPCRAPQDRALRAERLATAPALDHPSTRQETAARVWASVALVVVAFALLAVGVERADRSVAAGDALRATGVRVTGTVVATDDGDHVTVSYPVDGTRRSGVVTLDDIARPYVDRDAVTVFYAPAAPARMSIDDQDDEGTVSVTVMVVLVGAVATVLLGRHKRITVHVTIAGQALVLRRAVLLPPAVWREVSSLAWWSDGPCWVARSPGRRCVLAAPGGRGLWRMTTARSDRQARRWARHDAGKPSRRRPGRRRSAPTPHEAGQGRSRGGE